MPGNIYNSFATADVTIPTTTETVVATVSGVTTGSFGTRVIIRASAQVTIGTGATAITARIRRGTTVSGTLVGEGNAEAIVGAVGSTEEIGLTVAEDIGEQVGGSYVLTIQQTAATAAGTSVQSNISAEVGF